MKRSMKKSASVIEYAVIAAFVSGAVFVSVQLADAQAFGGMNMPTFNAVSDTDTGFATPLKVD